MASDFELLQAWRTGDERAGRELFDRHFAAIFRFFRNKVDDAAEDLTQQTFLGCVNAKDRFRGDSSFRTFIFQVARNRLYSHLREKTRRNRGDLVDPALVIDVDAPSATANLAAKREQALLLQALRHLPLDMQIALELHYWEDMTVREIAEIVSAPEGTVKRRLQRARERLHKEIQELATSAALAESTMSNLDLWAQALRERLKER